MSVVSSMKKSISILVFDLSDNGLVRVYPIARVLSRGYDVEIIGAMSGREIYNPYQAEFNFKVIKRDLSSNLLMGYYSLFRNIIQAIDGDIIYAFKPKLLSFGVGLIAKFFLKIPLVLDIEDLETANWSGQSWMKRLKLLLGRFDTENEGFNFLMEKFIPLADERIVVSDFLQQRFGGEKVVHGVDVVCFSPKLFDRNDERIRLGLDISATYILFSGMPREHKGLEELIQAIINIDRDDLKLLIVGGDVSHQYYRKLVAIGSDVIVSIGPKPHYEMPSYLAASDIVVLPQRKSELTMAQVPAKLFEAMAMEKAIICTNVSDLSSILDGCGVVIEPIENAIELESSIMALIDSATARESLGVAARRKCITHYSWDSMQTKLIPIFERHLM